MSHAISNLEQKISDMSRTIDTCMESMEDRVENVEIRITNLENQRSGMDTDTPRSDNSMRSEIWEQLKALELQVLMMKASGPNNKDNMEHDKTAVIGGLQAFASLDEAREWVTNRLWDAYGPLPNEMYVKGDFHGIAFAEFQSPLDPLALYGSRNSSIQALCTLQKKIWHPPRTLRAQELQNVSVVLNSEEDMVSLSHTMDPGTPE